MPPFIPRPVDLLGPQRQNFNQLLALNQLKVSDRNLALRQQALTQKTEELERKRTQEHFKMAFDVFKVSPDDNSAVRNLNKAMGVLGLEPIDSPGKGKQELIKDATALEKLIRENPGVDNSEAVSDFRRKFSTSQTLGKEVERLTTVTQKAQQAHAVNKINLLTGAVPLPAQGEVLQEIALNAGDTELRDEAVRRLKFLDDQKKAAKTKSDKQGLSSTFESVLSRRIERGEITFDEANEKLKRTQRKLFKVEIQDENGDTNIAIKDQEGNQIGNLGKAPKRTVEIKGASRLRQEFKKLPELKQFNEIELSFNKMLSALESGRKSGNFIATDQTLVTLFVKANEPDSVVRVSEFARTGEAQSLVNKVIGLTQKQIQGGAGLLDEDRVELVKLASQFKRLAKKKLNKQRDFFIKEAKLQKIDPTRLGPEFKVPLVTSDSTDEEIQAIFDETQRRNPGLSKEEVFNIMKGNR